MVEQVDIEAYVGADNDFTINCHQPAPNNAQPLDLTGASIWFTVKADYADADPGILQKTETNGIDIVAPATNGVAKLHIDPADTLTIFHGHYHYGVKVKEANGRETVIVEGKFDLRPSATRST